MDRFKSTHVYPLFSNLNSAVRRLFSMQMVLAAVLFNRLLSKKIPHYDKNVDNLWMFMETSRKRKKHDYFTQIAKMYKPGRIDPKTDPAVYQTIMARYNNFLDNLNDVKKPVIRVFDPLGKTQLSNLEIAREISKTLQEKKVEDMKKAAALAEEMKQAKTETTEGTETSGETTEVAEKKQE